MIIIPNKKLCSLEKSSRIAFIKEVCTIIEDIEKTDLNKKDALELVKKLFKNKVYESSNTRVQLLNAFTSGFKYSEINFK